jgi:hypothetical protein
VRQTQTYFGRQRSSRWVRTESDVSRSSAAPLLPCSPVRKRRGDPPASPHQFVVRRLQALAGGPKAVRQRESGDGRLGACGASGDRLRPAVVMQDARGLEPIHGVETASADFHGHRQFAGSVTVGLSSGRFVPGPVGGRPPPTGLLLARELPKTSCSPRRYWVSGWRTLLSTRVRHITDSGGATGTQPTGTIACRHARSWRHTADSITARTVRLRPGLSRTRNADLGLVAQTESRELSPQPGTGPAACRKMSPSMRRR